MLRRLAYAVAITLAGALALSACTPQEPATVESPSDAAPQTPSPSPTPTILTVAAGERPPQVFDGDCEAMLTEEEASALVGAEVSLRVDEVVPGYKAVEGAGGLACAWSVGHDSRLIVAVFPEWVVDSMDLQSVDPSFQGEDCVWHCTTVTSADGFVVVTVDPVTGATHETAAALAESITPTVTERAAATSVPWTRDRSAWIDTDCATLGAAVSAELDSELTGEDWGVYIDPPLVPWQIADQAAGFTACRLVDAGGEYAELWWYNGAAWGGAAGTASNGLPEPWVGMATEPDSRTDGVEGPGWVMSDGANLVRLSPVPDAFVSDLDALAAAVATGLSS